MITSRSQTTRQTDAESPPSSGDRGSLTLLRSSDAGSRTLSSQPPSSQPEERERAWNDIGLPVKPSDVSYMPLTDAAYWIATEGGSREFDISDADVWKSAFDQLLKKIVDDEVKVLGRRGGDLNEKVAGDCFYNAKVSYPYCGQPADFVTEEKPYLQCWGVLDEEHRDSGFDDKLCLRWLKTEWGDLQARGADVARHWPFVVQRQPRVPKSRPGAKMKYDWPDVREFVFRTMDKRREFLEWDTAGGWQGQADLNRLVTDYLSRQEDYPSSTSVKNNVKKFLDEWRVQQKSQ